MLQVRKKGPSKVPAGKGVKGVTLNYKNKRLVQLKICKGNPKTETSYLNAFPFVPAESAFCILQPGRTTFLKILCNNLLNVPFGSLL